MKYMKVPSTGMASSMMAESFMEMRVAMKVAMISMKGERASMRIHIIKAFCTLVTSLVSRVMREGVLNLSMFLWEKACTRSNRPMLRFLARPLEATAAIRAARTPARRAPTAISTIRPPIFST